uniref:Uncharacterized protein n=1 Tax=Physcomitrium patens TaxID=3218 RepID=A0A2K1ISG2_PHYPA|nr:hypothetical protein PHYPA_026324 [Physcomitrium patens]
MHPRVETRQSSSAQQMPAGRFLWDLFHVAEILFSSSKSAVLYEFFTTTHGTL